MVSKAYKRRLQQRNYAAKKKETKATSNVFYETDDKERCEQDAKSICTSASFKKHNKVYRKRLYKKLYRASCHSHIEKPSDHQWQAVESNEQDTASPSGVHTVISPVKKKSRKGNYNFHNAHKRVENSFNDDCQPESPAKKSSIERHSVLGVTRRRKSLPQFTRKHAAASKDLGENLLVSPLKKKPMFSRLEQHKDNLAPVQTTTETSSKVTLGTVLQRDRVSDKILAELCQEKRLSSPENNTGSVSTNIMLPLSSANLGEDGSIRTKVKRKLQYLSARYKRRANKQRSALRKDIEKMISNPVLMKRQSKISRPNPETTNKKTKRRNRFTAAKKGTTESSRRLARSNLFRRNIEKIIPSPDLKKRQLNHCEPIRESACRKTRRRKRVTGAKKGTTKSSTRISRPRLFRRNKAKGCHKEEGETTRNKTLKKYKVFSRGMKRRSVFRLLHPENEIVTKLSNRFKGSRLKARMRAKSLVKWCLVHRKRLIAQFGKVHKEMLLEFETRLIVAKHAELPSDRYEAMLGPKEHRSTTESYFHETSYHVTVSSPESPLVIREDGIVTSIFRMWRKEKKHYKWSCSPICKVDEASATERVEEILSEVSRLSALSSMVYYVMSIEDCRNSVCHESSSKIGHTISCRLSDRNRAPLLTLENLMPHYPRLRSIVRRFQNMKRVLHKIDNLDHALYEGDVSTVNNIVEAAKLEGGEFHVGNQKFLSENDVEDKFRKSFTAYEKQIEDLPRDYCFSCERLLFQRSLSNVCNIDPIENQTWDQILDHATEHGLSVGWICDYCKKYIKRNHIPPISTFNNMATPQVPPEIADLNSFEKMFIQLAKAFQVVVKCQNVMQRKAPATNSISKVVGRTFHLPLPLEQTLNRILESEPTSLPNQELFILVRGLPTKQRKVWESEVNVTKVLKALQWLKINNSLYSKIELPERAEDLLNLLPDTDTGYKECQEQPEDPDDPDDPGIPEIQSDANAKNPDSEQQNVDSPNATEAEIHTNNVATESNAQQKLLHSSKSDRAAKNPHFILEDIDICEESQETDNPEVEFNFSAEIGLAQVERNGDIPTDTDAQAQKPLKPYYHPEDSLPKLQNLAAMLTQRDKDDEFYAPFTIFPVYDKRENKLANEMYQMLKVQEPSLHSRTIKLDAMCFPDLYPDGKNGFHEDREVNVDFTDFVHAKLLYRGPQYRKSMQYLFYLLNQATNRQLAAGIYQTLNITRGDMTVAEFLEKMSNGEFGKDLSSVFQRVRNTEEYWRIPRSQILSMIDTYGPPTFFLTLSPADYADKELEAYLREIEGDAGKGKSLAALIADDPVSVSRFYDQKFKSVLAFLAPEVVGPDRKKVRVAGPLGLVEHWAWRREYQSRGTVHFHTLLWVKDAPLLGKSSSQEVAQFIQDHISCNVPDKHTFPTLHERVMRFQQHKCNAYCQRPKKFQNGVRNVCRFGFPRSVTEKLILRDVPTAIAGRRNLCANSRLYDLPRAKGEEQVNDYNPAILLMWTGNMDLQFVGEKSAVIGRYISKYQTKAEKSHMMDIFDDVSSNKSVYSKMWNIGLRGIANRECSAQEAADTLLSLPLFGTDPKTTFKWVDVSIFRSRKIKTMSEVVELHKKDRNTTDFYCPSLIDTHYPNRPPELENLSVYDYVKDWDRVDSRPTSLGKKSSVIFYEDRGKFLRKRENPRIVQHYRYDPKQKPEQYYYSLLLLFRPWRRIGDLKGADPTYTKAFENQKASLQEAMRYHEKLSEILAAYETITTLIEEKCKEITGQVPEEPEMGAEDLQFRETEVRRAMDEVRAAANLDKNKDLSYLAKLESQLNADQHRVYEAVKKRLLHYVQCKDEDSETVKDPLRGFVSGVGGTGKSFLIEVITLWVRLVLKKQVVLTAPTGLAASSIGGVTLHKLLQLPVEHGDSLTYTRLSDNVLEVLRNELKDVALIIIDEISMVSNVTLMMIHLRLSEIFDTHETAGFGCKNVLAFGDFLQIPPVKGRPVFQPMTQKDKKHFRTMSNLFLWREYFTFYEELEQNMRQKTDAAFCNLLANVRLGFCTEENVKTLRTRQISYRGVTPEERLKELANQILNEEHQGLCILPTNEMCNALNEAVLALLPGEKVVLVSKDSFDCKISEKSRAADALKKLENDCSRTAGLDKTIIIKVGARLMLKRNVDVSLGYVNSATGVLVKISRHEDGRPSILHLRMKDGTELPLEPVQAKFELTPGIFVHRTQFPVTMAYGVTIHKSQGQSLEVCTEDIGNRIFTCGQSYVALSRVKTLEGLNLINFDPGQIKADGAAIREYDRLRQLSSHWRDRAMLHTVSRQMKVKRIVDIAWAPRKAATTDIYGNSPSPRKAIAASKWPAFKNDHGVVSYANASLQCFLSYEPLRDALRSSADKSALTDVALQYQFQTKVLLSVEHICSALGDQFVEKNEQNPRVFLHSLIDNSEALKQMTKFTEIVEKCCKACNARSVEPFEKYILRLSPIGENKSSVTHLMDSYLSWSDIRNVPCQECKAERIVQRSILQNLKDLLIVELPLWEEKPDGCVIKNTKFRSPGLQTTTITIGNHRYKLHGALFHHGLKIESGHCAAVVVSGKKFISADDGKISYEKWPTGGVDAQLLFYRRLDPTNIGPKKKNSATVTSAKVPTSANTNKTACKQLMFDDKEPPIHNKKKEAPLRTTTTLAMWPRFENKPELGEKVSCYANATLQSLLSYEPIRSGLLHDANDSALKIIASEYEKNDGSVLSAYSVRVETGDRFAAAQQECVRDFLDCLINKHSILADNTRFTRVHELKCTTCNNIRSIPYVENILSVPIHGTKKNISELLDALSVWSQPAEGDPRCTNYGGNCEGRCINRTLIQHPSSLLVIQVNRVKEIGVGTDKQYVKDTQFQMANLPSTNLNFGDSHYKLHADLRHQGKSEDRGHYTAVVQAGRQFILTDDTNITQYRWTQQCGKNSHVLMYKNFTLARR